MKKNARFFKKELEEVDAILPFMSLLIIIIPLLLSNLAFYHFKVIETSFPGASDPNTATEEPTPNKKKMVMAKLLIEPGMVQLDILDESDGSSLKKERKSPSKEGGKELFELLKAYREKYPKLDTILVTTHEEVVYESLTNILHEFKAPIPKEGEELKDEESGFKFKIVILPATAEKSAPLGS